MQQIPGRSDHGMKPATLISVVTPSYNKVHFVKETVDSVMAQDYQNFEYIVMDGGSDDGSIELLKMYSDKLTLIVEKDDGQADAINKGFYRAKGDILGWLNADDVYLPSTLSKVAGYFDSHPTVMAIYGEIDLMDEAGKVTAHKPGIAFDFNFLLNGCCYIPQPATFFRSSVFRELGALDVNLYYAMDYDYWLRIGRRYGFMYSKETLARLRLMLGTKTGVSPLNAMPEALRVGRKHGARFFSYFRLAYWMWAIGMKQFVRVEMQRIRKDRRI